MAGKLFNRYLWLYDLLRRKGPIPFTKIQEEWARSGENDSPKKPLPLKTFHNHCMRIAEFFGVDVECEKGGNYGYYIGELPETDQWKMDIIDHMLILMAFKDKTSEKVINLDQRDHPHLMSFVNSISEKRTVSFETFYIPDNMVYSVQRYEKWWFHYWKYERRLVEDFLPLALAQIDFCWFLFGIFPDDTKGEHAVKVFTLDQLRIKSKGDKTDIDFPFNLKDYLDQKQDVFASSTDDHGKYLVRRLTNALERRTRGMGFKMKSVFDDKVIET